MLILDAVGSVLLVKPTYKDGWEIPGGLVEAAESPREAAARECVEELGREVSVGELLCVHYAEGARGPGDGVMFVFDGGVSSLGVDKYRLPPEELSAAAFVPPGDLAGHLPAVMVRRILAAIDSTRSGSIAYLER